MRMSKIGLLSAIASMTAMSTVIQQISSRATDKSPFAYVSKCTNSKPNKVSQKKRRLNKRRRG